VDQFAKAVLLDVEHLVESCLLVMFVGVLTLVGASGVL